MNKTKGTDMWNGFLEEIRRETKKNGLQNDNFLRWGVIRKTMHVNDKRLAPVLDYFESNVCELNTFDHIFEFGGGHGRICRMIHDRGFSGKYTIFDFPEMSALQKAYLRKHDSINYINGFDDLVVPPGGNTLFISMSALEESPKEVKMFVYAKNYKHFLFKYSGGKSRFHDFSHDVGGEWSHDTKIAKKTELLVGKV